jgi:hypothetical protein
MSKITLVNFGVLDSDQLEEYYDTEIQFDNRSIDVDINFENDSIAIEKLEKINSWLTDIEKINNLGLMAIRHDFATSNTVKEYIEHHLDELDSDDLKKLLNQGALGITKEEKLLSILKIKRIGFYPDTEERFLSLDYTLDKDLTDYLVVLDFTEDGNLYYITLES